jgi:hypothetical protein
MIIFSAWRFSGPGSGIRTSTGQAVGHMGGQPVPRSPMPTRGQAAKPAVTAITSAWGAWISIAEAVLAAMLGEYRQQRLAPAPRHLGGYHVST